MKINHNMSAVITNHQLLNNENSLSVSMEKLSSGLRINHAKDDAAGMAISTKMRCTDPGSESGIPECIRWKQYFTDRRRSFK